MFRLAFLIKLAVAILLTTSAASAGLIQPVSVSTDMMTSSGSINSLIDQSGLSATYTVSTNAESYLAATNHNAIGNSWESVNDTGNIDFDLGAEILVAGIALWSVGGSASTQIRDFTVLTSNDSDFSTSTNVGSFVATLQTTDNDAVPAEAFTLVGSFARYVRIQVDSNYEGSGATSLGEAVIVTPEPGSLVLAWLACLCAVGVGWRWRRRELGV